MTGKLALIIVSAAVVVVVVLGAAYFLMGKSSLMPASLNNQLPAPQTQNLPAPSPTGSPTQTNTAPVINNDAGLTSAAADLDNTDLNSVDSTLTQNDADAKSFAPRIRLKNGTSLNWAGYAVETNLTNPQSRAVTDVKGSWVVPAVDCSTATTNTYSAAWVGIDGYSDGSVEQTGTEHDCVNGVAQYSAWYEMYPKPSFRINRPVKAGDVINAEVAFIGNNKFVLTLADVTSGWTFTTSQKSNAQRQSAEWIMEAPWSGGVLPLANFGTIGFSNASATLNGHTGSISDVAWQNDKIDMTNSSGTVKAATSALDSTGSAFGITWKSSN